MNLKRKLSRNWINNWKKRKGKNRKNKRRSKPM